MRRRTVVLLLVVLVGMSTAVAVPVALRRPTNAGVWAPEQARLPHIRARGDSVWISDVRAFHWHADSSFVPGWVNRAYDLRQLRRVYFVLSPFARAWRGPAHTFLSFEFDDTSFLAVSVEARRRPGQQYSPLLGALRGYELMVVLGEESDLIGLRTLMWRDPVYLYPARATPQQARRLLENLLARARALETQPEFYNTLTNNCATVIVDAVNAIAPHRIPHSYALVLPGYSDALAYRLGLLATDLPLEQARRRFLVNARARAAADSPAFSEIIRR